jgi:hypothetical protein
MNLSKALKKMNLPLSEYSMVSILHQQDNKLDLKFLSDNPLIRPTAA